MKHVHTITVPFVRGKGRPRFVRATGRAYTPDKTAEAMAAIRAAWLDATDEKAPSGTPVTVAIVAVRPLPKSRPKRIVREADVSGVDLDNLEKLCLDALNGVAWDDDRQVNNLSGIKLDRYRDARELTTITVMWED